MSLYHLPTHMLRALAGSRPGDTAGREPAGRMGIDFCSHDYLGFSKLGLLERKLRETERLRDDLGSGSAGARWISGEHHLIGKVEEQIAMFHHARSALIFNSGYEAILGLLSSVPQSTDLILYDEQVNAPIRDGIRLSQARAYAFRHNEVESLEALIQQHQKYFENIYVVVESVYAVEGNSAPLLELEEICQDFRNIFLIVDETHAIGVFGRQGRGLCNALSLETKVFARIYAYDKAMGCHGAAVVGSEALKDYLARYARTLTNTMALPYCSVEAIKHAYQLLIETDQKDQLQSNIAYFYSRTASMKPCVRSQSAVHTFLAGSNELADQIDQELRTSHIHVRALRSPEVRPGQERICFTVHAFNTREEIDLLLGLLSRFCR